MYRHMNEIQSIDGFFVASKDAGIISNGMSLFTVTGGPVLLKQIIGVCVTDNNATATTVQFTHTPVVGVAVNLSIASGSIANKVAGDLIILPAQAFTSAPTVGGTVAANAADSNVVMLTEGTISTTVAVGPTTGTWRWYFRYFPLTTGSTVSA